MLQQLEPSIFLNLLEKAKPGNLRFHRISLGRSRRWHCENRRLQANLLWYFLQGGVEGTVEGESRRVQVPERSFHWLSAGVSHSLRKLDDGKVLRNFLMLFELHHRGRPVSPDWRRLSLPDFAPGRWWLEQAYLTCQTGSPYQFEKLRAILVALFIDLIGQLGDERDASPDRQRFTPGEIQELLRYVEPNLHRAFLQAELARSMALSPDYFARKFRLTFGISPREWLTRQRLDRAATLLIDTRLHIQEIAAETGFRDPRFFARQFRKHYGERPTEYRNRR